VDHLVITGVKPWDGRYELNLDNEFTTREWGWVKRLSGYLPVTLDDDAMSDPELACVLACIVLHRAGRIQAREVPDVFERLADAPFGSTITIDVGEQEQTEGDASPPETSFNGSSATSGTGSPTSSDPSTPTPPVSGIPGSDTSVSPPVTRSVT
jgi:hypothetical protein